METHIVEIRIVNPAGIQLATGDIYYDGLLLNLDTSVGDVQNRFGEGDVTETATTIFIVYDEERGRGALSRIVHFSFDINTNNLENFVISNNVNPNLSDAVWDGELRFPRIED